MSEGDTKKSGFGFGGLKNIGQVIKQQAEEIEKKAKEAAQRLDHELHNQAKKMEGVGKKMESSTKDLNTSLEEEDLLGLSSSSNAMHDPSKDGGVEPKSSSNHVSVGDTTETTAITTSLANRDLDSVTKEELLEILSKMNKKVKALAQMRSSLTDRVKVAEADKARLMHIMKTEVLNEIDLEEAKQKSANNMKGKQENNVIDEISLIQFAWRAADERNQLSLQQLQNEFKVMTMKSEAEMDKVRQNKTEEQSAVLPEATTDAGEVHPSSIGQEANDLNLLRKSLEEAKKNHRLEVEALKLDHKNILERIQSEADDAKNEVILALREQYESQISEMKTTHSERMDKLKMELSEMSNQMTQKVAEMKSAQEQELEKARLEILNMSHQMDESAIQHTDQLKAILMQHEETIEKMKKEAAEDKAASLSKLKEMVKEKVTQMKAAFEEKLYVIAKEHEEKLQSALNDLRASHEKEISEIKCIQAVEVSANNSSERLNSMADNEVAIQKLREEMQKAHQSEIEKLRSEFEQEKESLSETHNQVLEKLKEEADNNLNHFKANSYSENERADHLRMIDNLKMEYENKLSELQQSHTKEIDALRKTHEDALQSYQIESLRANEELGKSYHFEIDRVRADLSKEHAESVAAYESQIASLVTRHEGELLQASNDFEMKLETDHQHQITVLNERNEKIQSLESLIDDTTAKIVSLEKELELERCNSSSLQSQVDSISESRELIEMNKIEGHGDAISNLKMQLDEKEQAYSYEINMLKDQINSANVTIDKISEELEEKIILIEELESERASHQEALDTSLTLVAEESLDKVRFFEDQISQMTDEHKFAIEKLNQDYEAMLMSKDELKTKMDIATIETEELRLQSEKIQKQLQEKIDALENMFESLKSENLELMNDIKAKDVAIVQLQESLNIHESKEGISSTELESIKSDLAEAKESLLTLNERLLASEHLIQSLQGEIDVKAEIIKNLEDANALASADSAGEADNIASLSESLSVYEHRVHQLESESKELLDVKNELEESCRKMSNELSEKNSLFEGLTKQIEDFRERENSIITQKNEFEVETNKLHTEIKMLIESKSELLKVCSANNNTVEDLRGQVEALENLVQGSTVQISDFEQKEIVHSTELTTLKDSLQRSENQVTELNLELSRLRSLLELSEMKLAELTQSIIARDDSIASLTKDIDILKESGNEKDTLSNRLISLQEELNFATKTANEDISRLSADLKSANDSIQGMKNDHSDEIQKILAERNDAFEQATRERESLAIIKEHESELEILLAKKTDALKAAQKQGEIYLMQLQEAENDKNAIVLKIQHLESVEKAHASQIENLEQEYNSKLEDLKNKISITQSIAETEKAEMSEKIKFLEEQLEAGSASDIETIRDEYERKLADLKQSYDSQKKEILEKLKTKFNEKLQSAIAEQNASKSALQDKMTEHTDKLKSFFEGKVSKLKEDLDNSNSKHEAEKSDIRESLSKVEMVCLALKTENEGLRKELDSKSAVENELNRQLENAQAELTSLSTEHEAKMSSLIAEQQIITTTQISYEKEISALRDAFSSKSKLVEEMTERMNALQENLGALITEKEIINSKLEAATKQVARLDMADKELGNARDEINRLKLEQSQNSTLVERLKAERESIEMKHGQRTALVGRLEQQLQELNDINAETKAKLEAANYELKQKDDDVKATKEELDQVLKSLNESKNDIQLMRKKLKDDSLDGPANQEILAKAKLADSLQREVQSLQQQMVKKSSAAQKLLQQREMDCQELKARVKALQEELDKGSLSDRRIFELAAQQSNRESVASSEIEVRNQLVERLTYALESHDDDLAHFELKAKVHEGQVEELCRIHRREDVNLDYLKATIVQYLSKPPGSSERASLLPVIATLLQFDDTDYKIIENGKNKVSWFGSVMPTFINARTTDEVKQTTSTTNRPNGDVTPLLGGHHNTSAEITISKRPSEENSTTPGRRTTLQF